MPLRVAFQTLGCKLNQIETESIADAFATAGAEVAALGEGREDEGSEGSLAGGAADLVVINTCTVTGKAEQKARRLVRLALSSDPRAVVLVTGCYAEVEGAAIAALGERAVVLPGSAKDLLLRLPDLLAGLRGDELLGRLRDLVSGAVAGATAKPADRFAYNPSSFAFHSRPSLKVQDGCDNACAYCRVHIARGPSSSLPADQALARARALEAAGRAEIVLAGVNLSQYRDGELRFPGLLRRLVEGTEAVSFRLSSYEPDGIDGDFLGAFAQPRVRPHVHLALQSGADSVLSAMGRRYRREDALAAVNALRAAKGDPFIAVDLIAGFPGETEADAEATLELARECRFAWIHAFRFSPRPGTRAAAMRDRVPERVAGERVRALLELGARGRADYLARWRGRELAAVLESGGEATTENYLKVAIEELPDSARTGYAVQCCILGKEEEGPLGAGIDGRARLATPRPFPFA